MVKPERVVEAALFSSGRPVSVDEIMQATGLDVDTIRKTLRKLIRSFRNRDIALEVVKAGSKYGMQVKQEFVPSTATLAKTDIPRRLLKTLALIAYHQPVKQSELLEMVGQKVYEHVKDLHRLSLIIESPEGQTKILTTSSRFPEYFGIRTTKRDDIKKWMAEKVGIKVDGSASGVKPAPEILADKKDDGSGAGGEKGAKGTEEGKGPADGKEKGDLHDSGEDADGEKAEDVRDDDEE
jgi:segregation and condensation protein B